MIYYHTSETGRAAVGRKMQRIPATFGGEILNIRSSGWDIKKSNITSNS